MKQNDTSRQIQRMIKVSLQKVSSDPQFTVSRVPPEKKSTIHLNPAKMISEYRIQGSFISPSGKSNMNNSQSRSSSRLRILTPRKREESTSLIKTSDIQPKGSLLKPQSRQNGRRPIGKMVNPQPLKSTPLLQKSFATTQTYKIEKSRISSKKNGFIKSYAANTHNGLYRNYNEDRVSIILSIAKPSYKTDAVWPKCSFFAVYDGHGGSEAADFLRDNLHLLVIKDENFPSNPSLALERGIKRAEETFLSHCDESGNRSGSCAVVVLLVDDQCYVANVGDSRAVMSYDKKAVQITRDHKPCDDGEKKRIEDAGGQVYQQTVGAYGNNFFFQGVKFQTPYRVFPGKLSVSRTIGDYEAKASKFNGNPKVVICDPEVNQFQLTDKHDFILLACDGIFDRLTTDQVVDTIWQTYQYETGSIHQFSGLSLERLFQLAFESKTLDNITAVLIGLKGLKKKLFSKKQKPSPLNQQTQTSSQFQSQSNVTPQTSSIMGLQHKSPYHDHSTINSKLLEMRRKRVNLSEQKTI